MTNQNRRPRARENGEGSLYLDQSSGRWIAAVTVGVDENGRQIRRRASAKKRADAAAKLRKLLREADLAPASAGAPRTLGGYLDGWLVDVEASRAFGTYESYRNAVEIHIKPHLGTIPLRKLSPVHVQRWLTALADTGSRARQNAFRVLRTALNDAVRLRIVASNPTDSFNTPKHNRDPIDPFDRDEAAAIISSFEGSEWHLFVLIGFSCGLRQGEILGLEWGDLDGDVLKVRRQQTENSGKVDIVEPKSAAGRRDVPVPEKLVEAWGAARAEAMVAGRSKLNQPVFVGPRGGVMRRTNFRHRHWKPTLSALGLSYRSPHQMRHTYATLALAANVPINDVSRILGHAKTSTTLDVYGHAMPNGTDQAREFAAKLIG